MRLSAKAILTYGNVNALSFGDQWTVRAGEPNSLYFQLVDLDQAGLRYMPGIGGSNQPYSVSVTFPSLDNSKVLTIAAVQANASDNSIWMIPITALQMPSSGNVRMAVTEGSTVRNFSVLNLISVEYPLTEGSC